MAETDPSAFERVKMARHPDRPYSNDLFQRLFSDFIELHGDRRYADDSALVAGFAKLEEFEVAVMGHQKGRDTNQRRARNFGMAKPEGYRKALRIMNLAQKFSRPIITFIDTPGAYPGIDAEERGQAEAIAFNLREMASFSVPMISVILGEGGSGGALAIAMGDRVLMMENAVYSVITPEGCAAILWKDATQSERAANSLGLTAFDLKKNKLVDEVVEESVEWKYVTESEGESGDTSQFDIVAGNLKSVLLRSLKELNAVDSAKRKTDRYAKFRDMGKWISS